LAEVAEVRLKQPRLTAEGFLGIFWELFGKYSQSILTTSLVMNDAFSLPNTRQGHAEILY
jgi:hypothetical protein